MLTAGSLAAAGHVAEPPTSRPIVAAAYGTVAPAPAPVTIVTDDRPDPLVAAIKDRIAERMLQARAAAAEKAAAKAKADKAAAKAKADKAAAKKAEARKARAAAAKQAYKAPSGDVVDVARVRTYLERKGSPMAAHAEALVAAGVAHQVDPRVVVAIAGIESGFGQALPSGSHNAWGWSGDGPYGLKAWPSWPAAIDDYTARLGRLYTAADISHVDSSFASTYCPPNAVHWLEVVTAVGREM